MGSTTLKPQTKHAMQTPLDDPHDSALCANTESSRRAFVCNSVVSIFFLGESRCRFGLAEKKKNKREKGREQSKKRWGRRSIDLEQDCRAPLLSQRREAQKSSRVRFHMAGDQRQNGFFPCYNRMQRLFSDRQTRAREKKKTPPFAPTLGSNKVDAARFFFRVDSMFAACLAPILFCSRVF